MPRKPRQPTWLASSTQGRVRQARWKLVISVISWRSQRSAASLARPNVCGSPKSAVTQIRRLEAELGVQLFDRPARSTSPTRSAVPRTRASCAVGCRHSRRHSTRSRDRRRRIGDARHRHLRLVGPDVRRAPAATRGGAALGSPCSKGMAGRCGATSAAVCLDALLAPALLVPRPQTIELGDEGVGRADRDKSSAGREWPACSWTICTVSV